MKQLSTIFLSIVFACVITSCQKQPKITETMPIAYFTSDKATYTAGDVIHLKSSATNAYTYKWTMPDGSIQTTQNIELVTDSDDVARSKTFSLEVTSKSGVKSKIFTKKFTLQEYILPTDYYFNGLYTIKPTFKICRTDLANWQIEAGELIICLRGNAPPSNSGTYTIQAYSNPQPLGTASVQMFNHFAAESVEKTLATNGSINISITSKGKVRAVFNNLNATVTTVPSSGIITLVTISGDITCH
jgi:hypothetical protein